MIDGALVPWVVEHLAERFSESVIQRWTRHRASRFFEKFAEAIGVEVTSGQLDPTIDDYLDKIMNDDVRSEAMFDAYRRVCLSASRDTGPRIIGLLTGELVAAGREADETEESLFMAAEAMNDREFREFLRFYNEKRAEADIPDSEVRRTAVGLEIHWCQEAIDSTWHRDFEIQTGALDLAECMGSWALKMKNVGLLTDTITEKSREYGEDSERHIDESGTERTLTWRVVLPLEAERFATLVARAQS